MNCFRCPIHDMWKHFTKGIMILENQLKENFNQLKDLFKYLLQIEMKLYIEMKHWKTSILKFIFDNKFLEVHSFELNLLVNFLKFEIA